MAPAVWANTVHGHLEDHAQEVKIFERVDGSFGVVWVSPGLDPKDYIGKRIVLRGPIQFVRWMHRTYPSLEFVTNFKDDMFCHKYLSRYPKDWCLNSNGYWMPFGLIKQMKLDKPVFIRPDSPYKTFTGFTLAPKNFDIEIGSMVQINHVFDDELILVAENKIIDSEFRCVICNKEVIGFSEYRWDGILDIRADILPEVRELADKVAEFNYQIDDIYVVDIGMVDGEAKIIEFNSFCSSGLYACDMKNIVEKIERYIEEDYDLLFE